MLFDKCNINNIEAFLMQSQLRCADHEVRINDERLPKILIYDQLQEGVYNVGRLLRYKDKLKDNED